MSSSVAGVRYQDAARRYGLTVYNKFAHRLNVIWKRAGRPPRLGLAISGGVDSMALASLCRDATNAQSIMAPLLAMDGYPKTEASFVAFTVDHKLRANSGDEARRVAEELTNMGIESKILELDWSLDAKQRSPNGLETIARKLRYQALGTACLKARVNSLLLAHHADDVAETVMLRIITNYLGSGLAGMRFKAKIPDCTGIYGVDDSGAPHPYNASQVGNADMGIEHGGIVIWRPLLGAGKDALIDVCVDRDVRWFEDPTNAEPTFTLRNTVRFLQRDDVLPLALRSHRLREMAGTVAERNKAREMDVEKFIRETTVVLDLQIGSARVTLPQTLISDVEAGDDNLRALYLRHLLHLVAPTDEITVQNLDLAVDFVFRDTYSCRRKLIGTHKGQIQVAGVNIRRQQREGEGQGYADAEGSRAAVFLLRRAAPTAREQQKLRLQLWTTQQATEKVPKITYRPAWHLWDGRYWITVTPPASDHSYAEVTARFLNKADIVDLRRRLSTNERSRFERELKAVRVDVRYTLPVIVVKERSPAGDAVEPETVVALPSLGWSVRGWRRNAEQIIDDCWQWDIRYKNAVLDGKAPHSIGPNS